MLPERPERVITIEQTAHAPSVRSQITSEPLYNL